jgi:hypothetical protein
LPCHRGQSGNRSYCLVRASANLSCQKTHKIVHDLAKTGGVNLPSGAYPRCLPSDRVSMTSFQQMGPIIRSPTSNSRAHCARFIHCRPNVSSPPTSLDQTMWRPAVRVSSQRLVSIDLSPTHPLHNYRQATFGDPGRRAAPANTERRGNRKDAHSLSGRSPLASHAPLVKNSPAA